MLTETGQRLLDNHKKIYDAGRAAGYAEGFNRAIEIIGRWGTATNLKLLLKEMRALSPLVPKP